MPSPLKWIVAHRGYHSAALENSLDAFQRAIDGHADMIEFDVRLTSDGVLVVHHDPTFGNRLIAQCDYASLANLNGGPPRFEDVLRLAAGRIRLDVELKDTALEQEVIRRIFDHGFKRDDFVVTSFHAPTVSLLRDEVAAGLLVEQMPWRSALEIFHRVRPQFLAPDYRMIEPESGIPLLPWTVNSPKAIYQLLADATVLGIITDEPEQALAIRSGKRP